MERPNQNPRQWSELPRDLLITIANTLISDPISIRTFRSVCHSWRTSSPPLPNPSILEPPLPLSIPSPLSVTIIYSFHRPQDRIISSSSNDTWIIFVDEFFPGKLSIRKPFSSSSYITPINFPTINLIDLNARELGRFHNLIDPSHRINISSPLYLRNPTFYQARMVKRVVMFPNGSAALTLCHGGGLEMYRLNNVGINGQGIIECENKHVGKGFCFDDIVEFKGRVLGIDRMGRVYEIEYHSSELTPFVAPISGGGGRRKRLVESLGGLYLVVRCKEKLGKSDKRPKFNVYGLNEGGEKWCEITSLGDRSFLFGQNFSFSASAKELGTYVKNSILFTMNSFQSYMGYDDVFEEFLKLKNSHLNIGVWQLDDTDHFGAIESDPDYSYSFWPPQSWIWNVDRLERIGIVETAIKKMRSRVVATLKTYTERRGDSFWNLTGSLVAGDKVLNLQKMVIRYHQEGETTFMREDRESEDILNKEFLDLMSKVSRFLDQSRPLSHGTNEASLGRHAFLLHIEEQVTEVQRFLDFLFG